MTRGWRLVAPSRGWWHLLPRADLKPHTKTPACWCGPQRSPQTPRVLIHAAADARELIERHGVN